YTLLQEELGQVPDVEALELRQPGFGPAGIPIELRIVGKDPEELDRASRELLVWLRGYRGTRNLLDDLRTGKPELHLKLRPGALSTGIDARRLAIELRSALRGAEVSEFQSHGETYEVRVRLARGDRDGIEDLRDFRVTLPTGEQVALDAVAEVTTSRGWAMVTRVDARRTVTVQGEVDTRVTNAAAILEQTRARFLPELLERHPRLEVSLEGQAEATRNTASSLRWAFLVGLIGIYLLLAFQFRSYLEPLVVMAAIPLALIGVVAGHLLLGYDLCMPSMVGFVSLAGIVVNDSILLVEFLKMNVAAGQSVTEAARTASRARFRAVMLTSATTIAGLLPLMAERSLQAQVMIPLAISVVFGLLVSTALVLLVVPSLYCVLEDLGLAVASTPGEAAEGQVP
ncbi:MAG: efflux RND transporter permease subunit, partial [Acidobacteria bacterium]|nr:efflux RND transporter permease subunit [Acidobacteriota bacterium]